LKIAIGVVTFNPKIQTILKWYNFGEKTIITKDSQTKSSKRSQKARLRKEQKQILKARQRKKMRRQRSYRRSKKGSRKYIPWTKRKE
jgi:hypothetical protein